MYRDIFEHSQICGWVPVIQQVLTDSGLGGSAGGGGGGGEGGESKIEDVD